MNPTSNLLSINETARLLNLSPVQVRRLCREGRIHATRVGGYAWAIPSEEVTAFAAVRRALALASLPPVV